MALSPAEKKLIAMLATTSAENKRGVGTLAALVENLTICLYPSLRRCSSGGCEKAATIKHDMLGFEVCDSCAARAIVNALRAVTGDVDDPLESLRHVAAREELWVDLDAAQAIRTIEDHYLLLHGSEVVKQ